MSYKTSHGGMGKSAQPTLAFPECAVVSTDDLASIFGCAASETELNRRMQALLHFGILRYGLHEQKRSPLAAQLAIRSDSPALELAPTYAVGCAWHIFHSAIRASSLGQGTPSLRLEASCDFSSEQTTYDQLVKATVELWRSFNDTKPISNEVARDQFRPLVEFKDSKIRDLKDAATKTSWLTIRRQLLLAHGHHATPTRFTDSELSLISQYSLEATQSPTLLPLHRWTLTKGALLADIHREPPAGIVGDDGLRWKFIGKQGAGFWDLQFKSARSESPTISSAEPAYLRRKKQEHAPGNSLDLLLTRVISARSEDTFYRRGNERVQSALYSYLFDRANAFDPCWWLKVPG